jgi:3-dehydroquinate dehydratase-2
MKTIAVLNGPNLDRLGKREPEVYGTQTLHDLQKQLETKAKTLNVALLFFQTNHEGTLVDTISDLADRHTHGIIINAAALTHTSVALRDAIVGGGIPTVEVHISNIYQRETFRHNSYISPVCNACISGMGFFGYSAALEFLANM